MSIPFPSGPVKHTHPWTCPALRDVTGSTSRPSLHQQRLPPILAKHWGSVSSPLTFSYSPLTDLLLLTFLPYFESILLLFFFHHLLFSRFSHSPTNLLISLHSLFSTLPWSPFHELIPHFSAQVPFPNQGLPGEMQI